jgi:hypothetical protein
MPGAVQQGSHVSFASPGDVDYKQTCKGRQNNGEDKNTSELATYLVKTLKQQGKHALGCKCPSGNTASSDKQYSSPPPPSLPCISTRGLYQSTLFFFFLSTQLTLLFFFFLLLVSIQYLTKGPRHPNRLHGISPVI